MRIFGKDNPKTNHYLSSNLSEWQATALDFVVDVVIIFLLVFLIIRPFVIAPFQVQQSSMEPNVHDGEYIIVNKLPYNTVTGWSDYARGDVVVFRPTTNPDTYLIKRILGTPGDTIRITDGAIWVQDSTSGEFIKLDDSYLGAKNQGNTCLASIARTCPDYEKSQQFELTVPAGQYLLIGDNRLASRDGRTCFLGTCADPADRFVDRADIEGVAWFTFFPLSGIRTIPNESSFVK